MGFCVSAQISHLRQQTTGVASKALKDDKRFVISLLREQGLSILDVIVEVVMQLQILEDSQSMCKDEPRFQEAAT